MMVTSSGEVGCVPSLLSSSELSKAANADCFDDVLGFGVFLRIYRFGFFKSLMKSDLDLLKIPYELEDKEEKRLDRP